MSEKSKIEWTHYTFNPWIGCVKVSPGCDHCYAEREFGRKPHWSDCWGPGSVRRKTSEAYWKKLRAWDAKAREPRAPWRVFVGSMCDVFDPCNEIIVGDGEESLQSVRNELWLEMERCENLTFMILTKRPIFIRNMIPRHWINKPLHNVWYGVSVENQDMADSRIPQLLGVPGTVRFVSLEPLLGPIDLTNVSMGNNIRMNVLEGCGVNYNGFTQTIPNVFCNKLDWVIIGGESGPGARPMHPDWVRSIRDQCVEAGVPFFFKQWGAWLPEYDAGYRSEELDQYKITFGQRWVDRYFKFEDNYGMVKVGKKRAGRILDGKICEEWPR